MRGLSTAAFNGPLSCSRMETPPKPMSWAQQRRIQQAVALMEANFASRLSREEMARAAGLSVSLFQ